MNTRSDYQYSAKVVYNNFAWCEPTSEQKKLIETTAQNILDDEAKIVAVLMKLYERLTNR